MGTIPILGFSRMCWRTSTSSQSICSDGGFCPRHQCVCVCGFANPHCQGPPSLPRKNSAIFLAPNSCRNSSSTFPVAELRYPLLAGRTNQQTLALPPLRKSRPLSPGLCLTARQVLEQREYECRPLASLVLCNCVQTRLDCLDNGVVKSPAAALHSCSIIITPSKAAPACDRRKRNS